MIDLKYRYLTLHSIPYPHQVNVRIIKDYGLQEFEKEKKFQLVVQILNSSYSISEKRSKNDELLAQLVLTRNQRVKIAKMRELKNLEGVTLTIQHERFFPFGRRKAVEFLAFHQIIKPDKLKQETLLNSLEIKS